MQYFPGRSEEWKGKGEEFCGICWFEGMWRKQFHFIRVLRVRLSLITFVLFFPVQKQAGELHRKAISFIITLYSHEVVKHGSSEDIICFPFHPFVAVCVCGV